LRQTQLAYRDTLNYVSQYAYGYDEYVALIQKGTEIGAAKLWYDKPKKQFYLLVSLEIETADPTPKTHTGIVGVDVGVRYLAVTATRRGEQSFYTGKRVVPKANHYARPRKRLQKKGTRSATRRLVAISKRERRLKADANHKVSKRIMMMYPHSLIGMEEMTGIRERTKQPLKPKGRVCEDTLSCGGVQIQAHLPFREGVIDEKITTISVSLV
jgi:transposase